MSFTQELSDILHENLCYFAPKCKCYSESHSHYLSYQARAKVIMDKLEPEIGAANVVKAARVFLDAFV